MELTLKTKVDPRIRTILFDLHHTLTEVRESPNVLLKRIAAECDVDLSGFSEEELQIGFTRIMGWFADFQIENDVGPRWGGQVEDWIEADRRMFEALGITDLSYETIFEIEKRWKYETCHTNFETILDDAFDVVEELHSRGYKLGICTRRHDNPTELIEKSGLSQYISTIQWSGVPGYTKPNPYILISAAIELGVNPRCCAYVGNIVELDVYAAIRADMLPILTTWANPEEANEAPDHTIVVDTISDLLELFS
jgi:HAD superfamily hydrolase (TIGR01549 family)